MKEKYWLKLIACKERTLGSPQIRTNKGVARMCVSYTDYFREERFILNDKRKKFWVRLVVVLMLAAFILPSIIMLFNR